MLVKIIDKSKEALIQCEQAEWQGLQDHNTNSVILNLGSKHEPLVFSKTQSTAEIYVMNDNGKTIDTVRFPLHTGTYSTETTEILCIMDRSSSMSSIMPEAVNAFNEFVQKQKALPGKANLTLVAFDNHYEVKYDSIDLNSVPLLTINQVQPRGMTALNDAIGRTINRAKDSRKTIVLIQTDGEENCSQEFDNEQVKALINAKKELGWEFIFIGAGIDAFDVGHKNLGIDVASCYNVSHDAIGMADYTNTMTFRTMAYRDGSITSADLDMGDIASLTVTDEVPEQFELNLDDITVEKE